MRGCVTDHNVMTIPLDIVLDLPSVDAVHGCYDTDNGPWGTVRHILDHKSRENEGRGWDDPTWQQETPIHLFLGSDDQSISAYGMANYMVDSYRNQLLMGNGHHRVANLYNLGRKFVYFTFDYTAASW